MAYNVKSEYTLKHDADVKTLRAEFQNAIAPALNAALEELALRHTEVETNKLPPRRFCSAFEDVQELANVAIRRALGPGDALD